MSSHVVPIKTYLNVFWALMGLMLLTVVAAYMPFGPLHIPIALTIAIVKAVLIMAYFMHLKYSHKLTWLFAGASSLWLVILIAFAMSDFLSRGWISAPIAPGPGIEYFGGPAVPDREMPHGELSEGGAAADHDPSA